MTNLHFTEIVPQSNSVRVALAWPTNLFREGTILDFFVKVGAFSNDWTWASAVNVPVGVVSLVADIPWAGARPDVLFLKVGDRFSNAVTMDDFDRDGIPDVYELHHGTNPYVEDAERIPRLTVGSGGTYGTLAAALAQSAAYSVVSLAGETFESSTPIVLPPHPVLVEGPPTGYAVLRSSAGIAAVMLTAGQTSQTLFRNLIVELRAVESFQAGFWIGGNTPWSGRGAAATFENVHIRAPYPGVEHFGWLFYRNEKGPSRLSGCTMNAAGSTWAYGVSMYNAASNRIEDCAFLNMPTNLVENLPIAVLIRESTNGVVGFEASVPRPDLSWGGCPLGATYDPVADSDGDGLSDWDEVFVHDTDPRLADSDGDGIPDGDEVRDGTDPHDVDSHAQRFEISVTNTVFHADMTNYVFAGSIDGWGDNLLFTCTGRATERVVDTNTLFAVTHMGAFRDLNRNGAFDSDEDILLTRDVSGVQAVKRVRFAFGDVDGDGVDDLQERRDGTDPYSGTSVKISRKVKITNRDSTANITNYWFIAASPDRTTATWSHSVGTTVKAEGTVTGLAVDGFLYVVVYRDFNRNGIFDAGVDAIVTNRFANGSSTYSFTIGDADSDGVEDGRELVHGTDPLDAKSYCFQATLDVTDIFTTTNALACQATWGDAVVLPTRMVETNRISLALGHLATTNRAQLTVWFWDDSNGNGIRDTEEASTSIVVGHTAHDVAQASALPYGGFDKDRNGLLDWWERQSGLSDVAEPHGGIDDNDGDGMINLHEFWAGTDPLTPDGSNTLLSVCARSVDDRIKSVIDSVSAVGRFVDFFHNASNGVFVANTNFWAKDLDFGCVSVWSEDSVDGERPATAITKRHVVMANHWHNSRYVFCDTNGMTHTRMVVSAYTVPGTDLRLGRLDEDLPDSISIPKILPSNYVDEISTGKYLPGVCLTHEKTASVAELSDLDCSQRNSSNNVLYHQLGQTASTNHVSLARNRIRAATTDGYSGCPVFLVMGNQLVFLFSKHLGHPGVRTWTPNWGPMITHCLDMIQSRIDLWEGDESEKYRLNVLPLECFNPNRSDCGENENVLVTQEE
ncbi:MAG: hypothetical protein Q4G65_00955 [bacterium]|nr:hypothetical protein [bacterium]